MRRKACFPKHLSERTHRANALQREKLKIFRVGHCEYIRIVLEHGDKVKALCYTVFNRK